MYRRSLDIAAAGIIAALGALAAAAHASGPVTVVLGLGLFFAPGYVWSEAILGHRLPGVERTMAAAVLTLILPVLGGFLFYLGRIPLLHPAWIGMLAILTFGGVVVVAFQRYRAEPSDERPRARNEPPAPGKSLPFMHIFIFGCAAVIALGSVGYSVISANAQKYPGYTALWMTGIQNASNIESQPVTASLGVTNYQGVTEHYQLKLTRNGKVASTLDMTLTDGQTWQSTIAYTTNPDRPIVASLYLLPNLSQPYRMVDNTGTPTQTKSPAATTKPAGTAKPTGTTKPSATTKPTPAATTKK
jgi:hypothetical protein